MNTLSIQHAKTLDIEVAGGSLLVSRIGNGPKTVLALHGVAGSRMSMEQLAGGLDGSYTMLTPDLRGRGASSSLPGPFGLEAHAADCGRILEHFGCQSAVVVGHSMGALVAERLAAQRPDHVRGIVLIDGGLPPAGELPVGIDVEQAINAVVGPILDNLRHTYATEEDYFNVWRNHPAFQSVWNENLQTRFQYDLKGHAPTFRSRICPDAIKQDMIDALSDLDTLRRLLCEVRCRIRLVRATRGILDQPVPMISDELAASWSSQLPLLTDTVVQDSNHVSITLLDRAIGQIATCIQELST